MRNLKTLIVNGLHLGTLALSFPTNTGNQQRKLPLNITPKIHQRFSGSNSPPLCNVKTYDYVPLPQIVTGEPYIHEVYPFKLHFCQVLGFVFFIFSVDSLSQQLAYKVHSRTIFPQSKRKRPKKVRFDFMPSSLQSPEA